jgi:hypothetical protein
MRTFVIIATMRRQGLTARVARTESTTRLEVKAETLPDAYKAVRSIPEFKHAFLLEE